MHQRAVLAREVSSRWIADDGVEVLSETVVSAHATAKNASVELPRYAVFMSKCRRRPRASRRGPQCRLVISFSHSAPVRLCDLFNSSVSQ
jgi:hypothetical protein